MNQKELDALEKVLNNYMACAWEDHQDITPYSEAHKRCKHIYHQLQILNDYLNRIKRLHSET